MAEFTFLGELSL